ncbi:hypothetical protein MPER_03158, partial [Moniliophthora perniciosa FA553]
MIGLIPWKRRKRSSRDWDRPGLMDRILNRDSPPDPPSSPLDEWEASTIL